MSRFVGFKARFAEYDEQAAALASNLGLPYDGADLEDGTLYLDIERVVVVVPIGDPMGSESTLILDSGTEIAVLASPEEVINIIESHVTRKA